MRYKLLRVLGLFVGAVFIVAGVATAACGHVTGRTAAPAVTVTAAAPSPSSSSDAPCMDPNEINKIIQVKQPTWQVADQPICEDGWVYVDVEGGSERTRVVLHNGQIIVEGGSGPIVLGEDHDVCGEAPPKIIAQITCVPA